MNKRVLITGGAGFIGHTLIHNILKQTNWDVVTIDRLDYSGNLNRLDDILGDISKEEKQRLDVIFHDLRAELNSQIVLLLVKLIIFYTWPHQVMLIEALIIQWNLLWTMLWVLVIF